MKNYVFYILLVRLLVSWSTGPSLLTNATVSGGGEVGQVGKPLVSIAIVDRVPALSTGSRNQPVDPSLHCN